jgi:hypothetical protein
MTAPPGWIHEVLQPCILSALTVKDMHTGKKHSHNHKKNSKRFYLFVQEPSGHFPERKEENINCNIKK